MARVGDIIAELRKERGWTLRELSNRSGVSVSHLSAIENHTRPSPSLDSIQKIAQAFEVSLSVFDGLSNSPADDTWSSRNETNVTSGFGESDESSEFGTMHFAHKLAELYDEQTITFIISEQSRPYVHLALSLAEGNVDDPSEFLQRIAVFMQEHRQNYSSSAPDSSTSKS